jgi:hypothetical protein
MSTLTSYASAAARDSAAPAASNTGLCIFRSDTNAIEVSNGTNYQTYNSDGVYLNYSSGNTHSGDFDGNDYAVGTVGALSGVDAFSASFWFRYNSVNAIPLSGGSNTSNRWYLHLINSTKFEYGSSPSGSYPGPTFPQWTVSSMSSSNWYHVALIHDNTSVTLYLNGASQGTNTGASSANQTWRGTNLNIGRYGAGASFYWNGWIDEVSVFNRALTSSEVTNIYSNKLYLSPTALWRLNNDTTDELGTYDLTNNTITFDGTNKAY